MPVPITALYAALLGLVTLALQIGVGRERLATGVSLHDGGNRALAEAIRRHANFTEHVPFALLLMAIVELNGAGALLLHGLGAALLACRVIHPFGIDEEESQRMPRFIGAFGTLLVTLALILVAGWQAVVG